MILQKPWRIVWRRGACFLLSCERYLITVRHDSPIHDQLICKALERFRAELGDDDYVFTDVRGPDELLIQAKDMEPRGRSNSSQSGSLFRLESILSHINDFAAIAALSNGAGAQITGIVWGSLKVILTVCQTCLECRLSRKC